ncbi:MAG: DOMON domain-containing protein [Spirochaeta sp.]|jgi:hypothetical protein|nr:DOMON domain-containing protein [Spirochaeta sp.]
MKRTTAIAALIVLGFTVFAGGTKEIHAAAPELDGFSRAEAAGVDLQWRITGDALEVQMSAQTTGWVSVGFDPSRQMADANIVIGYVADGTLVIADDYGVGPMNHDRDTSHGGTDDISQPEGTEENGRTTIRFVIPLDSGDAMDKPLGAGSTYTVLVAYGPDGADDFSTYHAARGSVKIEL